MATAWFGPCPHCRTALSYLQGVTGSTMTPKCPSCRKLVEVARATFLMADHSGPTLHRQATKSFITPKTTV
jgi:hypothetical protein